MGKNLEFNTLEWDTEYFDVSSAKITLFNEINEQNQKEILNYSNKYDFITVSNLNNLNYNNVWLGENTNAFLIDTNIQLFKKVAKRKEITSKNINIIHKLSYNSEVLHIASTSFKTSRFINDPYLPNEKSGLLYYTWTKNAFDRDNKYFAIYKLDDKVVGYLLFSLSNFHCIIELIAVDQEIQGKNIGSKLILSLENFLMNKNIQTIQVGTQVNNIFAIRFYTKMGFKYTSLSSIYHWWPNECTIKFQ